MNTMDPITKQFIDVREPAEFESEKIPGTRSFPLSQLENLSDALDRTQPLLITCRTGGRAQKAAEKLRLKGFTQVEILEGGIEAWKAAGKPTVVGSRKVWAMDRQVRCVAGSLVLVGALGGTFLHPGWYGLSAFVGAGLLFSALTNTCTMALLLARMPWNQTSAK
jgi:rhodanese-related sulfurtransferase